MRSYPIKKLVERARRYADMQYTDFVSNDPELLDYLNVAYGEYYDLLVDSSGDYYKSEYDIVLQAAVNQYALPDDFYKITTVEYVLSPGQRCTMRPFMVSERNQYGLLNNVQSGVVALTYIPAPAEFTDLENGTIDGQAGWEDYVSTHMAIQMLNKEESDVRVLIQKLEALKERIRAASSTRDQGMPYYTTDIYKVNPFYFIQDMRYRLSNSNEISFVNTQWAGVGYSV